MGPSGYLFLHYLQVALKKEAGSWKMLLSPSESSPVAKVAMVVMCVAALMNTYV